MIFERTFEKTFDNTAMSYDAVRPMYVTEIFDDIFRYKTLDENSSVLEIGIGTGKATFPFLKKGCSVCALEPGKNLAVIAAEKYREYGENPAVFAAEKEWVHGKFTLHIQTLQEFDSPQNSFDLIYSATAFHWIPEEYGYKRVYELLKEGGVFARFSYHAGADRGRSELAREIQHMYKAYMNSSKEPNIFDLEDAQALAQTAENYGFADTKYYIYETTKDFTSDEYLELLWTYPDHMKLEKEKREKLFQGIYDAINRHGGVITVYYVMDLELARKV